METFDVVQAESKGRQRTCRETCCPLRLRDDLGRLLVVGNVEIRIQCPVLGVESDYL